MSTQTAPPQHLQALDEANRVRIARADLKRRLKRGELSAAEALAHPVARRIPDERNRRGMTVGELLRAQDRWGSTRVRKLLSRLAMSENRRVGDLTDRQRTLLSEALAE